MNIITMCFNVILTFAFLFLLAFSACKKEEPKENFSEDAIIAADMAYFDNI